MRRALKVAGWLAVLALKAAGIAVVLAGMSAVLALQLLVAMCSACD